MSEQYSKADIQVIAEGLIEELRECEDGTDITTCQLLRTSGYDLDEFDCRDFFHIHDALFKAAKCNRCKKDFGRVSVLLTPKKKLVEDYRDIVTSISFSVGGYFGGYTDITIRKNKTGAVVRVEHTMNDGGIPEPRQITSKKWESIVNKLYSDLYLHEWKKRFVDPGVLDGTQWELNLKLTNRRKRSYYGSNDYPPYWDELLKIFREFAKL